jgi:hypothetical protein
MADGTGGADAAGTVVAGTVVAGMAADGTAIIDAEHAGKLDMGGSDENSVSQSFSRRDNVKFIASIHFIQSASC